MGHFSLGFGRRIHIKRHVNVIPLRASLTPLIQEMVGTPRVEWFTFRKGMSFSSTFATRILPFAKDSDTSDITNCDYIDLPRNIGDSKIVTKYLGGMDGAKKGAFTMNQIKAYILNQWNGEYGELQVRCLANIFFVLGKQDRLYTVSVCRIGGEWYLHDWLPGEVGRWPADSRVFRNNP